MFKKLLVFDYQRSALQSVGFYFAWSLMGIIIGGLSGIIGVKITSIGAAVPLDFYYGRKVGYQWGSLTAMPFCLTLALLVSIKKRLGFGGYLVAAVTPFLAAFAGSLLGLLPVAYLTTRPKSSQVTSSEDP